MSACARDFRSSADPESGSKGSDSRKSAGSSLGAIYAGPRIIALDSPDGRTPTKLHAAARETHSRTS